ncbi:hypothetical protein PIB30_063169 [Stylosanthes scabra]|uniref:GRF-type domain-containing protein n=1 Tax=Stylosanthes scabra TaxID=79078 RepID=A0ABU6YJJ0_9FABA|nr:hypothetical protein [Stylosanthes scabra]
MDLSQGDSLVLSSGSSMARSINNHKRRHLCFCGEELVVMSSSSGSSHGRRYVASGRKPKCSFFEWIDEDEKVELSLHDERDRHGMARTNATGWSQRRETTEN